MEVQEFAPRHLVSQLVFKRKQAALVDRRGELADELGTFLDASSVSLDATSAEVSTDDEMSKYRIGIAQMLAVVNIEGFDDDCKKVKDFLRRGSELLEAPPIRRVVAHTSDVAAVSSFEDLRDGLAALSPGSAELHDAVGVPLSDVGWSYDFKDDQWVVEVRVGPMQDGELRNLFDAPEALDFPAASLFLDVKVVLRAGVVTTIP